MSSDIRDLSLGFLRLQLCPNHCRRRGLAASRQSTMTTPQRVPQLDDVLADLLTRRQSLDRLRRLTTVPAGVTDFSSNAYLSLSSHPEVQRAFLARLESSVIGGSSGLGILGSGGSRLLDGNSALAESLEGRIAAFHRAPAGLLFNSAMDANVGLFSCVPQPGDVVVYDELIHASVHDGMRLSRAGRRVPFAHNCVYAGPARSRDQQTAVAKELMGLEAVLRGFQEGADGTRNVFVVVEGLYSMDGDVAPLKDIVECVERCLPRGNGYIIVDEAHSTGIFGDRGRGLVSELGLEDRVWARVLGFGKAMGCAGGTFHFTSRTCDLSLAIRPGCLSSNPCLDHPQNRHCALQRHHPIIPHQLRPHPDLHHIHALHIPRRHRGNIQLPDERTGRALGHPSAQRHPACPQALRLHMSPPTAPRASLPSTRRRAGVPRHPAPYGPPAQSGSALPAARIHGAPDRGANGADWEGAGEGLSSRWQHD